MGPAGLQASQGPRRRQICGHSPRTNLTRTEALGTHAYQKIEGGVILVMDPSIAVGLTISVIALAVSLTTYWRTELRGPRSRHR